MSMTIFLRVCLCFLVRLTKISQSGFWRSLKATARWWFSRTDSSLYIMASSELVLIRNWFVSPGWSTSWMAAAKMADITSRGVKTHCDGELAFCEVVLWSYLKCRRVKEDVSGLRDIGTVNTVMIWNIWTMERDNYPGGVSDNPTIPCK